ncbi:MAG TPA: DUF5666 domain-containing protein, partial [Ktedonobacteraceae bacterium]|nr:DUF5666 domain-containing protein [Ktedonobacteraceae bacterium]
MQKPSVRKLLFLAGIPALMFAAFLMGGITLSMAGASSAHSAVKTPLPSKPGDSKSDNRIKEVITVNAVIGNKIQARVLESSRSEDKGRTVTILTTSQTSYDPDRSIVAVGKTLAFAGVVNSNGSVTALNIAVFDPTRASVGGVSTHVDSSIVTLQGENNQTYHIHLTSSTTILKVIPNTKQTQSAALSDLKVGEHIMASGTLRGDGSLTAVQVTILPEEFF